MIIRLIFVGIVAALSVYAYQLWMGPKALRVPQAWRNFALKHPAFAEGLDLRRAIGRILLKNYPDRLVSTLSTVDAVLQAIMDLIREQGRRGDELKGQPSDLNAALGELTALHAELSAQVTEKNDDALDRVRERLAASTADLKQTHQLEKELDRELD